MSGALRKAAFVDVSSPQAEWRMIHRVADAAQPAVEAAIRRALLRIETDTSWTRVAAELSANNPTQAVAAVDLDGLQTALREAVWPLIYRTFIRAGKVITQSIDRRPVLAKAKRPASPTRAVVSMSFNETNPLALRWAQQHAGRLITQVTDETRKTVNQLITRAFSEGIPPRPLARMIRQHVGLNEPQSRSLFNRWVQMTGSGMSASAVESRIDRLALSALRDRSMTIARTELMAASNSGQMAAWRQGRNDGIVDRDLVKTWIVTPDDRLCPECEPLDGEQVALDEEFSIGVLNPPAHPNCRCAVGLDAPRAREQEPSDQDILDRATGSYPLGDPTGLDTLTRHTIDGALTDERQVLHDAIARTVIGKATPVDSPTAYVLGGGPASGKSTMLRQISMPSNAVTIDPDNIRALLPEYRDLVAARVANASSFTHEEAKTLARRIGKDVAPNYNVIYDGTGDSSFDNLEKKVAAYRANGQKVVAHYVTVDVEAAVTRMVARGEQTGRFVPETYLREVHREVSKVLPRAMERGLFDEVTLWDTNGKTPLKVVSSNRKGKLVVHDERAWARFLRKAKE